jgi:hypothetical protein
VDGVGGDALASDLVDLERLADAVKLECSRVAAALATTDHHELQGAESPIEWMQSACHLSGYEAAEQICVGRELPQLPGAVASMREGRVGFGHLRVLARTAEKLGQSSTAAPFDERDLLLDAEKNTSLARFRDQCMHYRHSKDPKGYAEDEVDASEWRELRFYQGDDGITRFRGAFESAAAAVIRTALEPLAHRCGKDDKRDKARREADALLDIASYALDCGKLPTVGGVRPHIQVTTSYETLLGMAGAPAAQMQFGLPISSQTLGRFACDASVVSILYGADSAISDVSKAQRVAHGSTRKARQAHDQGCRWPGCDRPITMTELHHTTPWMNGGKTSVGTLISVCYRHHWCVHEGGWKILEKADGTVMTIPPRQRGYPAARGPGDKAVN